VRRFGWSAHSLEFQKTPLEDKSVTVALSTKAGKIRRNFFVGRFNSHR